MTLTHSLTQTYKTKLKLNQTTTLRLSLKPQRNIVSSQFTNTKHKTQNQNMSGEGRASEVSHHLCVKTRDAMERFEATEDCFMLDFDPSQDAGLPRREACVVAERGQVRRLDATQDCFMLNFNPCEEVALPNQVEPDRDVDICLVAERGQVACRDYPHSRDLCLKFPFEKTPHESYCQQCYCYVCDSPAPCTEWGKFLSGHCHATARNEGWKAMRNAKKMKEATRK